MAELTVPQVNFSGLGDLPQIYKAAQKEQTLANLGRGLADGTIDYKQAGATLAGLGDIGTGLSLMKMGDEQKAGAAFSDTVRNMYQPQQMPAAPAGPSPSPPQSVPMANEPRGIRNNNPLNLEASPFTQRQPGYTGSDGRFGRFGTAEEGMAAGDKLLAGYGERGINTVAGIINRWAPQTDGNNVAAYAQHVASKVGIDPNQPIDLSDPSVRAKILPAMAGFENGRPVKVAALGGTPTPDAAPTAAPAAAPIQTAQASPAQALPAALMQDPSTANIGKLLAASVDPRLPPSQKEVAKTLLTHALKASELTTDQKEYLGAVAQGEKASFTDWVRGNKGAGATKISIDQKGEAKFDEEFGKKQADRWNKYIENADSAERKLVDINTMREIHRRAGSQGVGANIKEAIGPFADALGLNVEGLSDIQAYSQVIQRLAPQQRAPGSGSTSDIEFKGFLKSLPGLSQNAAAREVGLNTMEALARDDMARGAIATKLATGEIKRADAEKEMRALPDPMKGFVEWRKANPDIYGQSLKAGAAQSSSQQKSSAKPPSLTNDEAGRAAYQALQKGDQYTAPDGTIRTKQ